jgi:H+/Cl- antiporter ClcA
MKLKVLSATTLKNEVTDWRLWWARAVVIAVAAAAGLTVVGFTWISEHALALFFDLRAWHWWTPLLWTPLCAGLIVWLTRRYAIGAAGSGIPQVMASLDASVAPAKRGLFVSLRLSVAKIILTSFGLLAGLSLGREGPSVQVAAGIMLAARRYLPKRSSVTAHGLLVAGGAAGIAAAFNTPLAGVMFAIEELSRSPEQRNSGLIVTSIVLAGMISVSVYGNSTYFGMIHATGINIPLLFPALLVVLLSGLAGGIFSRLLLVSLTGSGTDKVSRFRKNFPVRFAVGCGLAVAIIGVVTNGATFGSGYTHTRNMIDGSEQVGAIYLLLKFCATWFTAWSGVPAGIFAPSLAIGAALGNDIAMITHHPHAPALIAMGMVGFLAAATQAPLTSFIIVMEMVDGHTMVLSLMACALMSNTIARLLSPALYPSLANAQLQRLPTQIAAEQAEAEEAAEVAAAKMEPVVDAAPAAKRDLNSQV